MGDLDQELDDLLDRILQEAQEKANQEALETLFDESCGVYILRFCSCNGPCKNIRD